MTYGGGDVNGKAFDFGVMVAELAGDQRGRDEYYRVLRDFGCTHANEFKSVAEARRAYRVLLATVKRWEAEPATTEVA